MICFFLQGEQKLEKVAFCEWQQWDLDAKSLLFPVSQDQEETQQGKTYPNGGGLRCRDMGGVCGPHLTAASQRLGP